MIHEDTDGATDLDLNELNGLKHKYVTKRDQLNELEFSNIQQGLLWLRQRKKEDVLTDTFQRKLHKRLFGDVWSWAGTYRKTEKNIGIVPNLIPVQLVKLLENAKYWAEENVYEPLEAAARFHHRLVFIHAFPNGNGRHGRIAADLYLEQCFNAPPIMWDDSDNNELAENRRKDYIDALRAADNADFNKLLKFVVA